MPENEKTRERTPANLGTKFNPNLGAANAKRFQASIRALLKTSDNKGDLALAVLEGRADSSKKSLVLFEPRALNYKAVCKVLEETGDEAKALQAGKTEARDPSDVTSEEHEQYLQMRNDILRKIQQDGYKPRKPSHYAATARARSSWRRHLANTEAHCDT